MKVILPPKIFLYEPLEFPRTDRIPETKSLRLFCDILDEYGKKYDFKYWIDWGTLLGAHREGKIIDWDYDIDVSCIVNDKDSRWGWSNLTLLQMLQQEFFIQFSNPNVHLAVIPHDFKNFQLNHIDMTFHRIDGKTCMSPSTDKNFRTFFIDELETEYLSDIPFSVPRHRNEFLSLRYGENWRVPDPKCRPLGNLSTLKETYTAYTAIVGDMFHIGHLNLLRRCKEHFDKVVVGVHNDMDVMSYKGKPVIPYEQRLEIIRSCKYVDEVLENAPPITTDQVLDSVQADYVVAGREDPEKIKSLYPVSPSRLHLIQRTENVSSTGIKETVRSV